MASSNSGNVNVVSIGGRLVKERERLIGMTAEERAWRKTYLESQILASDEPITTLKYYKDYYNPFRRIYMAPLNKFESLLIPRMGSRSAHVTRIVTSRLLMSIFGLYCACYYFKYNKATWLRKSGWKLARTSKAEIPGTADYTGLIKPNAFATYGFENSPI